MEHFLLTVSEGDLEVETLDKFMECKAVKEKKVEMEKKLEKLKLDKVGLHRDTRVRIIYIISWFCLFVFVG